MRLTSKEVNTELTEYHRTQLLLYNIADHKDRCLCWFGLLHTNLYKGSLLSCVENYTPSALTERDASTHTESTPNYADSAFINLIFRF